jgi:presenilin-like A22 family membrane protease
MKHKLPITIVLALLFLISHITGLFIIKEYLPKTLSTGEVVEKDLPLNIERPQIKKESAYIPIVFMILAATIVALVLIKFQLFNLWKFWFFVSIFLTLTIALSAFFNQIYAIVLSIILALLKLFKRNVIINNLVEVFIYGGLAAIFVPLFNLFSIIILLILISIYDFYSVFKSKHMIKLAKFQTKAKIFSGLSIPYKSQISKTKLESSTAILGGGDVGFTLFFSGVILRDFNFLSALVVSFTTMLSLLVLLFYGKKGKFYPAMPILSLGCFIGYLIIRFLI